MGIVFNYASVDPALVRRARRDRTLALWLTVGDHDPQTGEEKCGPRHETLNVDKAWDGLMYLLSAERRATDDLYEPSDLLARAVDGGELLHDELGWDDGEPRFLSAADVGKIARALGAVNDEALRANFDPERMEAADVYPGGWSAEGRLEYLLHAFEALRAFFARAAERKSAVVRWWS
jgi:hypothetical protein